MSKSYRWFPLVTCVIFAANAFAQTSAPNPPFLSKPSQGTTCRVTIDYPAMQKLKKDGVSSPGETASYETRRELLRSDKVIRVTQFFSNDTKMTSYYVDGRVLVENRKGNPEIHTPGGETWPSDFRKGFFPELDWVKPQNYKGSEVLDDRKYHLYEDGHSSRLYVDATTMLPAELQSPTRSFRYTYKSSEGDPIDIPPKLVEALRILVKNSGQSRTGLAR